MLFEIAKNSPFLQNVVATIIASLHPSIEHNLAKIQMLKKAFFHCELESVSGDYFEFGVFEGTSLYAAVTIHRKLKSDFPRSFYGFDSFDDGFKYFNGDDKHPFFKEGDFQSSYQKVLNRFKKFNNVHLIKGYFEDTVSGKNVTKLSGDHKCAIVFLDCDLQNPAYIGLRYVRPILQPGSVIILDDYWAYKANPRKGTCGALNRILEENSTISLREFYSYGHGGMSFIVTEV